MWTPQAPKDHKVMWTPAVEGTTDDVDTTGLEKTPRKKNVDVTNLKKTLENNSVETTGLDEGDVDTTSLERKPGNEDLYITGLEEQLQNGETAPFAPIARSGEVPDCMIVTSTKPKVFERKSFLSKSWSNNKIKEIKPKDLNCSSFEPLLAEKIRCPSMRMNNSERIRIYQESFQWVTIPFEHSFVMPSPCLKFPQKWLKNSGT